MTRATTIALILLGLGLMAFTAPGAWTAAGLLVIAGTVVASRATRRPALSAQPTTIATPATMCRYCRSDLKPGATTCAACGKAHVTGGDALAIVILGPLALIGVTLALLWVLGAISGHPMPGI